MLSIERKHLVNSDDNETAIAVAVATFCLDSARQKSIL